MRALVLIGYACRGIGRLLGAGRRPRPGEPITQHLDSNMTITKLYDYLIDAADEADHIDVRFDRSRHIPTFADIDFIKNAVDNELRLNVRNLIVTGS